MLRCVLAAGFPSDCADLLRDVCAARGRAVLHQATARERRILRGGLRLTNTRILTRSCVNQKVDPSYSISFVLACCLR